MFWLVSRLVVWPVKAVAGTAKVTTKAGAKATTGSFKAGYRTGRLIGYRRVLVLGAGVGVGLLVAPRPGRELREQLRTRLEERGLLQPGGGTAGDGATPAGGADVETPSALPDVTASAATGNGAAAAATAGEADAALVPPDADSPA